MATLFPSIYRAKATQLYDNARVLKVLVPQVFGEQAIEVTHFLGPPTIGMGWVLFQGGNPEFPVWTTRVGPGGGPDYTEEIVVIESDIVAIKSDIDALQTTDGVLFTADIAIDGRLDVLEATDVSLDGRVDTLEATDVTLDGRLDALEAENPALHHWNSAWGLIGIFTPAIAQGAPVTTTTGCWLGSVSVVAGRRYKITVRVRAFNSGDFALRPGGANTLPFYSDSYFNRPPAGSAWSAANYSMVTDDALTTGSYYLSIDVVPSASITNFYAENGWIEDVGPIAPLNLAEPVPEVPPFWTNATLINSWTNYGAGFAPVAYRKIGDEVSVRGLIAGGSPGTSCAVLPVGFRPPLTEIFAVDTNSSTHGRVDMQSSGAIHITTGSGGYLSLSGIRFSVTP